MRIGCIEASLHRIGFCEPCVGVRQMRRAGSLVLFAETYLQVKHPVRTLTCQARFDDAGTNVDDVAGRLRCILRSLCR